LEETLKGNGESIEFRTKLRDYTAHCCETASKLMNTNDVEASKYVLRDCEAYVKTHARCATPEMLY